MPEPSAAKPQVSRREIILNPPFDLEPHECPGPGVAVDLPAIMTARREEKMKKAEKTQDSRRRKLERLRA